MNEEISVLSFERAVEELDGLIARLEGGQIDLADAVAAYERGTALSAHCAALLDKTEATITQLVSGPAGGVEVALDVPARARAAAPGQPASAPGELFPGVQAARRATQPAADDDIPF